MSETGKTLDKLIAELPQYYRVKKKIVCPNNKKLAIMDKISANVHQKHTTLDGLKIFFGGGWVLIRPSGTEPILRVYSESKNKKKAEELSKWAVKIVGDAVKS